MLRFRIGLACCAIAALVPAHASAAQSRGPVLHPFLTKDPAAVASGKRRARFGAALSSPMESFATSQGSQAVVSGPLNQPGLSASDNTAANDGSPPDPTGAAGPNNYVEFVNSKVRVYDKGLSAISTADLDTFVGFSGDSVFDVQIQWDPQANRWEYLADDCTDPDCATQNYLAYGFSKSGDPSNLASGWCTYRVETDNQGGFGLFDDYPKLGHNDTHIIFGTNVFLGTSFVSSRIWTVQKPSAGTITTCPGQATEHYWSGPSDTPVEDSAVLAVDQLQTEDGNAAFTPVPADTMDSSANGYVVAAHDPNPGSKVMAWHVDGGGNLVADGDITVSSFAIPANVPQPGTSDVLDSSDTRLTQAVALADPDAGGAEAVWTQHTINGSGGHSVDRWYELIPATKARRQEGNVSDPANFVFNGAISPTMSGNEAVIEYNVGGGSQLAQIWASSRTGRQPLNAMGSAVKLGDSTHFDQDFTCPSQDPTTTSCRWGDYAGATPDPAAATGAADGPEHRVWGTNQLIGDPRSGDPAAPHWITRNFALIAEHAPPIASFTVSPATASHGQNITFDGSGSHDSEAPGGIASYAWDFDGDGTTDQTSTTPTVTHAYATLGTFTAKLVVTDSDDGLSSAPASQTVTIQNAPPVAAITFTPFPAIAGKPVAFSGTASHDPDGSIVDYKWDLDGNGTFETDRGATQNVSKTFATAGVFTVGLQVQDSDGATGKITTPVQVVLAPVKLVLTFPRKVRLKALLAHGLRGKAKCGRSCVIAFKLTLPKKSARKAKTKTVIGKGAMRISGSGSKKVTLRLTRAARKALTRANPAALTITVAGTARDTASHVSRAKRKVKVKR